jgi:AcrR family transcriptional regulator
METGEGTMSTADEWVSKGLSVLAERGEEAVRVEPLAKALGVTKGSFYWHFRDRQALLDAMLVSWQTIATQSIIDAIDKFGGTPAARLTELIGRTSQRPKAAALEQAIRAWAARSPQARAALEAVDEKREGYVRDLLIAHGLSKSMAARRSRILYLALIGEFAWVSHGGKPSGRPPWDELVGLVLG